jgi:opacity protein-like surface antigen
MSVRKLILAASVVCFAAAAAPSQASADWLFTPYLGATFGGSANIGTDGEDFGDEFERKVNYGASLAWVGDGALGFEVDFGYSPNFFSVSPDDDDFDLAGDGNVTTLMANLVLGAPAGGVRPYASGGVGLIKSRVDDAGQFFGEINNNDFGFNLGAGVTGFVNDNVGIRGDVRYFRSLRDNEPDDEFDVALSDFRFWRGTVGVSFRF